MVDWTAPFDRSVAVIGRPPGYYSGPGCVSSKDWICSGNNLFSAAPREEKIGQNPGLRDYLQNAGIAYVMAIPKNTQFTDPAGDTVTVNDVPTRLRPNAWVRRACGIGTKGYRVYDWAVIDSDHPDHQYMIRRSIDDGELAFYHCYNPRRESISELVRVAGSRWPIEECFEAGKGQVGLDNYQVRLYHAWYRHMSLAMLAQTFLAVIAHRQHTKKGGPRTRPCSPTDTARPASAAAAHRPDHGAGRSD